MEKQTKILLGVGAVIAAYLILKPKKAMAQTDNTKNNTEKTKDCVVETYNCVTKSYETIQIPIDANCYEYQPDKPQCAEPMPDMSKIDIIDSGTYTPDRTNWGTWGN